MPRKIKGWMFLERFRESDAFEEYKWKRRYIALYGEEKIKILYLVNQFGQPYTDIYRKKYAREKRRKRYE